MIGEDAPPPKIRLISYTADEVSERRDIEIDQLPEAIPPGTVAWIDVQGFGHEPTISRIGAMFDLHRLAIEDVVNAPQRPKAEAYEDQLLIVTRMVRLLGPLRTDIEQVSLVLGGNWVITFQERPGDVLDPVRQRLSVRANKTFRERGAAYLAYAILDTIVDGYYPVLESLGDQLEDLEEEVINDPSPVVLRRLNEARQQLAALRRALWPQREMARSLLSETPLIPEVVRPYLRDVYDHCVQTADIADGYRETVTGLINTYLSSMANRTNDVMRVLTIMASIFIPLTFMAGIYGMNFQHMPELNVWWAYPMLWVVMGGVAVAMLVYFWRKGWIGADRDKRPKPPDE